MEYLILLDVIGTIAFALAGYIISSRAGHDLLGITIISFISAFGGGIIRDLLTDSPAFIFTSTYPLTTATVVIIISFLLKYHHKENLEDNKLFIMADTIGLAIFAYACATAGIIAGFNFGGIVFLAMLTAVGGGTLRDMLMQKTPYILTGGFYATVSIIIGILVYITHTFFILNGIFTIGIITTGIIIRLIAIEYNWKLPALV